MPRSKRPLLRDLFPTYAELGLQEAIEELPHELRMVLLLVDLEGFTHKETADILEAPVSTVRGRLYRARRAFNPAFRRVVGERDGSLEHKIAKTVLPLQKELVRRIAESPDRVFELTPREFEELVAEILDKMGLAVHLTPQTRDGGRDILASFGTPFGELLAVVECKRHSPDNPVGIAIVERMLHTIRDKDRASLGMIVTTSRFTDGAVAEAGRYRWQLLLRDYQSLQDWLRRYGTYFEDARTGLWLPQIASQERQ